MNPVYINGCGLASSLGASLAEARANAARTPAPSPRTLRGLPHAMPYHAIAPTNDSAATNWLSRCTQLVRQVAAEAGHQPGTVTKARLYIASSSAYVGAMEQANNPLRDLNDFSAAVARMLDWQGPVLHINSACTSSLNALLDAKAAIERGFIDDALIIGLELDNQLSFAGFSGMQLLSHTEARPFHPQRDGQILGEAVAALRLGRTPARWRLAGGAHVIDSTEVSSASVAAYQTMLARTLEQARWTSAQVNLVKVQASGSLINDAIEAEALHGFFDAALPALVSLKPHIGHTLGASGAAEIALLLSLLDHRQWPKNHGNADLAGEASLAAQPPSSLSRLLVSILGFGGSHACVAIESVPVGSD